jgi:EAL domain-containing protein (putative c-di-GMP-specific phosphodiesterase class I)/GGDEF domain-containing protein
MSLIKQLWIGIIVMSVMALGSSFFISVYQTRLHLMEHLYLKNADNAAVLAMTLSQANKDNTTLELMLSAQFDTGYYQRISLLKPDGSILFNFEMPADNVGVPAWFKQVVRLDVAPGIASVQDGWHQFATLEIESQYQFSLVSLWSISTELTVIFSVLAIFFGVVGQFFLKGIRKPLNQVVQHAEAIGERRFVISDEPKTLELKNVVKSMNKLSGRVKSILDQERQELDELHSRYQTDGVTSALNRAYGINWLSAYFANRGKEQAVTAFMLRIVDLQTINLVLGRVNTDTWLQSTVTQIQQLTGVRLVSRLNGSDFLLLIDDKHDLHNQAEDLLHIINAVADSYSSELHDHITLVGSDLKGIESSSRLLSMLDNLLASAQAISNKQLVLNTKGLPGNALNDGRQWFAKIKVALATDAFEAEFFPVRLANGKLLHQEAMMRLTANNEVLRAGDVLGWAARYNLLAAIDMAVLQYGLRQLSCTPGLTVAVNLSDASLSDIAVHYKLLAFFDAQPLAVLSRLAIEFDEQHVIKQQLQFIPFIVAMKKYRINVGIQRCTVAFTALPELEQLGLDYVKIDAALINSLAQDEGGVMVSKIIKLSHALGLQVIAEGVDDSKQLEPLKAAGFDGYTGLAVV